jgi:hypothetical protein
MKLQVRCTKYIVRSTRYIVRSTKYNVLSSFESKIILPNNSMYIVQSPTSIFKIGRWTFDIKKAASQ